MGVDASRLVLVGLSHHTAPIEVREQLALDETGVRDTLARLTGDGVVDEAMLLSTCNRVEMYAVTRHQDRLAEYLPRGRAMDRFLYWRQGRDAVQHLMRVACALDSLVVGEPQILGQVKEAVRVADDGGTLGQILRRLTQRTFTVAKRVRSETAIGRSRVGIGNAGVDLALQVFGGLKRKRALLVGTGEMGRQVSQALLGEGLEELLVTNRTLERAVELASQHGGTAVEWSRLSEYLARVDIVVVATGARTPVVDASDVKRALKARRYEPLFLFDLSVPRNVDPLVSRLDDAYLFNVDDLEQVVSEGQSQRSEAAEEASVLVQDEADRFIKSLVEVDLSAEIGVIARKADALRVAEIERSHKLLDGLDEAQRAALDQLTRGLMKKVLHGQIQVLRSAARSGDAAGHRAILDAWKDEDE